MACCTGSEIDLKEMKTAGQKDIGKILAKIIKANMEKGATPFGGQLSQPPDQGMMAAMNTMMNIGGYGGYSPPVMPGRPSGPIGPQPVAGPPVGLPVDPGVYAGPIKPRPSDPRPAAIVQVNVNADAMTPAIPGPGSSKPSLVDPNVHIYPDSGPTNYPSPGSVGPAGPPVQAGVAQVGPVAYAQVDPAVGANWNPVIPQKPGDTSMIGTIGPPVGTVVPVLPFIPYGYPGGRAEPTAIRYR